MEDRLFESLIETIDYLLESNSKLVALVQKQTQGGYVKTSCDTFCVLEGGHAGRCVRKDGKWMRGLHQ